MDERPYHEGHINFDGEGRNDTPNNLWLGFWTSNTNTIPAEKCRCNIVVQGTTMEALQTTQNINTAHYQFAGLNMGVALEDARVITWPYTMFMCANGGAVTNLHVRGVVAVDDLLALDDNVAHLGQPAAAIASTSFGAGKIFAIAKGNNASGDGRIMAWTLPTRL